jgi:glucose-6-phosphate isomerase
MVSGFDVLTRGDVLDSALQARDHLVASRVPAALAAKDPGLWGHRAGRGKLGWLDLPTTSRTLLTQVEGLVAEARDNDLDHIVLVGLGADGLAAQAVMDAGGGQDQRGELTVLDGGDAAALGQALKRLDRTQVILASKAGTSIEGDAYRRVLVQAFRACGMTDREIASRFIAITDHGSPLDGFARRRGYRVGLTDPHLPGHFGALGAYGLVPAMLAGLDVKPLLDQATAVSSALTREDDNPGLLLGAILGGCVRYPPGGLARDKVVLRAPSSGSPLTAWVAQLLATGTGKRGRGILPLDAAGLPAVDDRSDLHGITVNPGGSAGSGADTSLWAPLGAQFLLWEYATAVAGWLLGVDPFQSATDLIEEAEEDAAAILRRAAGGPLPTGQPTFVDDEIEVHADPAGLDRHDLPGAMKSLLRRVPPTGYLSVLTYLSGDFSGRYLAPTLARHIGRPVTYGNGPGYLHGTGSYHKDGPGTGAFLVVTGTVPADHPVPGRPYTLGTLQLARALADVRALRRRGVPVVRLHLREPIEGAARLLEVVRGIG